MSLLQAGHLELAVRQFYTCKSHSKSRSDCDACKRRRKKCDELIPHCLGFSEQYILCHYPDAGRLSRNSQKRSMHSPNAILSYHGVPCLQSGEIELPHHFHHQTLDTLGSLSVQEVIASSLAAALGFNFLKYAMFNLASSHLSFLSEQHRHDLSMNHDLERALLTFRQRLSSPITPSQIDAVLTSCVLLNTIAFSKSHHSDS